MNTVVQEVPLTEVWRVRREVMYPQGPDEAVFISNDASGIHLGLYDDDQLCSVISLFKKNNELQFRKFATLTIKQRRGYGTALLHHVFATAKAKRLVRIWCNARTTATSLYEKFGMKPNGDSWEQHGFTFVQMEYIIVPNVAIETAGNFSNTSNTTF